MAKQKFDIIQSTCIPIQIDNCNTDLIIPARYLASTTRDPQFFGDAFMHDLRFDAEGNPTPRTEKILRATPMNRFGEAEELLGTLRFLANSEACGFVTGVSIPVDGGFSAYSGV